MTECLTIETIDRYRKAELTNSDQYAEVDRHIADCGDCRTRLQELVSSATTSLAAALAGEGSSFCLEEDQIADYVGGRTGRVDREIVEAHTADCARCREDVASLREFREEMQRFDWSRLEDTSFESWAGIHGVERRIHGVFEALWRLWNGMPLSLRILIALALGVFTGLIVGRNADVLQPFSEGILNLLGAVATPLIFIAVIHALMHTTVDGKTARKLVVLLITNSLVAVGIGCMVMAIMHPGNALALHHQPMPQGTPFKTPDSILEPLVNNNVLYVIFLAVAFGLALRAVRLEQIRAEKRDFEALEAVMETIFRCLLRVLEWVVALVPVAVYCSAATLVRSAGSRPLQSIGGFVVAVLIALLCQALYYLVRIRYASHVLPVRFLVGARSAVLAAFSTASSAATMPLTYDRVKTVLGVRERATSLGVLIGGSLNRDGTALFEAMGVLFLAQIMGLHLQVGQMCVLIVMAVMASICAPGVPEAGLITMTLVLRALGLAHIAPYIVFLLPLDWFLDRCRTAINVLGHITVACVLDGRSHGGSSKE